MDKKIFRRNNCRLCESQDLDLVFSLAPTPPANAFLSKSDLQKNTEEKFPLDVFFCKSCHHVQLLDVVDPEILFGNYVYVSGTSPVFVNHFKNYADHLTKKFSLTNKSFVVEVGSNDGTLLKFFKEQGMRVLGIDPARAIAQKATQDGIPTKAAFFNEAVSKEIVLEQGKADAVIANNVFAHIDDLKGTALAVRNLLAPNGVFVFEVSYLVDVVEKTLFDTIYHEHLCYHSVKPLRDFFTRIGMELFHVESVNSHGGSLRAYVQLKGAQQKVSSEVQRFISHEDSLGLFKAETFRNFAKNIDRVGNELRSIMQKYKKAGKKLAGFGAPAKATTLMHHFGIGLEYIDFIVDDSPLKQNLYSPGLHIPVLPATAIAEKKPDYLIILAWNFADSIVQKNQAFLNQGGHFIVPLPHIKEV